VEVRIVTMSPWATQTLIDLELDHWVAGCSHDSFILQDPNVAVVTRPFPEGMKEELTLAEMFLSPWDVDMGLLRELAPSHIITEDALRRSGLRLKEAEEILERGGLAGCRLVDLSPSSLKAIFAEIEKIGSLFGTEKQAALRIQACRKSLKKMARRISVKKGELVVGILQRWPWFQLASRWLNELMIMAGAVPLTDAEDPFIRPDDYFERLPKILIVGDPRHSLEENVEKAQQLDLSLLSDIFRCEKPPAIMAVDGPVFYDHSCTGLENNLQILGEILHGEPESKGTYWQPVRNPL